MNISEAATRLRLWPAILISIAYVSMQATSFPFGPNKIVHGWMALVIWWLVFSRVPIKHRLLGLGMLGAFGAIPRLLMHPTMDFVIFSYVVPSATTLIVVAWLISHRIQWERQRWVGLTAGVLTLFTWTLVRVDGVSGELVPKFSYRWKESAEVEFLRSSASLGSASAEPLTSLDEMNASDWPGFRGFDRNGVVSAKQLGATDASSWPPRELWRRPVGPAWSSMSVVGNRLLTQEQRGQAETLACYRADTGDEIWTHGYEARFETMLAGIGPRATPTIVRDRVLAVGANGMVTCVDLHDGTPRWQYDIAKETQSKGPQWGFSSSPLVHEETVIVYGGASDRDALLALDLESGQEVWKASAGSPSYSSPQLAELGGKEQVLIFTAFGLESFEPSTGSKLWSYEWAASDAMEARIIQPNIVNDDVLIGSESKTIRLHVSYEDGVWTTEELWSSRQVKPDFNDFVILNKHAYGFDGSLLCCIDLAKGRRTWRQRGYGKGQLLLLQQEAKTTPLLLVLSESGDVSILSATPDRHDEVATFHAISGKTWNHPVVAAGHLYVRNASEMACFRLATE